MERRSVLRALRVTTLALLVGSVGVLTPDPLLADGIRSGETPGMGRLGTNKRLMDPSMPTVPRASGGARARKIPTNWFWKQVSPSVAAASTRRWSQVLDVMEAGRLAGKPIFGSQTTAQRIYQNYGTMLKAEAKRRNISLPFLIAVIAVESNGNPKARSHVGAGGLMQLMPQTAKRFGVADRFQPGPNIRAGTQYLDWLLKRYNNDAVLALAGYNAGEGAVDKYAGVPPFRETRAYVAKVAGAYLAARRLCASVPKNARDVCEIR